MSSKIDFESVQPHRARRTKKKHRAPPPRCSNRTETATADNAREPDPSPHHRDVLADPRGPTRRLSATLVSPPFAPRWPSTSVTSRPSKRRAWICLSTTLIYTRTPTPSPSTARSTTVQDTISIRLGTAPLSTPLVVECETSGRAEGAGQWRRGTLGSGGKGVPVRPPSLHVWPDSSGPDGEGGNRKFVHVSLLSASGELVAMGLWPAGARDGRSVAGHGQPKRISYLRSAWSTRTGRIGGRLWARGVGRAGRSDRGLENSFKKL
ncbi:hypothetical protein B0T18DRAFT_251587 [Schizothecium vesticola]|uniref:Uncharacterized protein n=1 Tax=Schizothecium vesticola TaxID=314040 RepID=A0AA40BR50_9PEZI|nr:hypothetical protein B0T18DRAFT_251587 [Schizothecium vesticola]